MKALPNMALCLRSAVAVLVLAPVAFLGGCDLANGPGAQEEPPSVPDWVEAVHPDPGAVASPTPQVQVIHGAVTSGEGIRLIVNGTDVTQYAEPGQGVLAYDPNRPEAPVELGPGTHEASILRVSLDEFGEQHEVLERFDWTFTVQ